MGKSARHINAGTMSFVLKIAVTVLLLAAIGVKSIFCLWVLGS